MKRRYEWVAVAAIIVLAILIIFFTTYNLLYRNNGGGNASITSESFIEQPVVDVIIPSLFRQGSTGGVNSPLNLTQGQSALIQISLYSTVSLHVSMQFQSYLLSVSSGESSSQRGGNASYFVWKFQPSSLMVPINGKANTTLSLNAQSSQAPGVFSAVVTAVNSENNTQMWGDIFQINVK